MATGFVGSGDMGKGLYQAPQGLDDLAGSAPDLEIEIEDPEKVTIGMDGLEVVLEPGKEVSDDGSA